MLCSWVWGWIGGGGGGGSGRVVLIDNGRVYQSKAADALVQVKTTKFGTNVGLNMLLNISIFGAFSGLGRWLFFFFFFFVWWWWWGGAQLQCIYYLVLYIPISRPPMVIRRFKRRSCYDLTASIFWILTWLYHAFSRGYLEGMAWNLACWCILPPLGVLCTVHLHSRCAYVGTCKVHCHLNCSYIHTASSHPNPEAQGPSYC